MIFSRINQRAMSIAHRFVALSPLLEWLSAIIRAQEIARLPTTSCYTSPFIGLCNPKLPPLACFVSPPRSVAIVNYTPPFDGKSLHPSPQAVPSLRHKASPASLVVLSNDRSSPGLHRDAPILVALIHLCANVGIQAFLGVPRRKLGCQRPDRGYGHQLAQYGGALNGVENLHGIASTSARHLADCMPSAQMP